MDSSCMTFKEILNEDKYWETCHSRLPALPQGNATELSVSFEL